MSEQIDLNEVKKAVEAVNKGFDEFKKADAERDAEIKRLGAALPETDAKLAKLEADMEKAQKAADDAFLAIKRSQRIAAETGGENIESKAERFGQEIERHTGRKSEMDVDRMAEYSAAYKSLMRANFDKDMISDAERKTLSVGQDSQGGYYVYPDLSGRIVQKVFETSPMRAFASVQAIGTDALEGYFDNDEVGFGWVSELEARPTTSTPQTGKWRIPVHEMYAMPDASQNVLDDALVDLEAWLDGKIADRFARAENTAFVGGDGVGKPRGFLTYDAGTTLPGQIEDFRTTVNGAFAAAPNGGDVLMDALYGLKAPYRANAVWFMNRTTTRNVRKLKDEDGAYLWQPGIAAGQPATLLGYPVASFEDMQNSTVTGAKAIAVGDMRAAYQIVDRIGIRMLRDPYTAKPKILFYATKRTGGDVVNFEAIKTISFQTL